jgi:hydrogenase maturation protease
MNLELVDQIAKAVLYEGYMLYPYRPSSVKNRQRWNFGVVYPRDYSQAQGGDEPCRMRTECLVSDGGILEVKVRFLHLGMRSLRTATRPSSLRDGWQEAVEREVSLPEVALGIPGHDALKYTFMFPSQAHLPSQNDGQPDPVELQQEAVEGIVIVSGERVGEGLFKVSVEVQNVTPVSPQGADREAVLMQSLVSTHVILGVKDGEFVSLLEPPAELQELASSCQNIGAWPVLVGKPGQRDTVLASPIILYDYPQIAPESAGDLFDGTEIDEILSLRIMTLTDEEKREIRESDDRAREILDRTEAMPPEQFMKMHGVVRGLRPLKEDAS